jgi:Diacylglycerol acyltransferase
MSGAVGCVYLRSFTSTVQNRFHAYTFVFFVVVRACVHVRDICTCSLRWSIVEKVSRYLQMSLILFYGRLGLPIPFAVPLLYALGRPIETFKDPNPSTDEIDFVHNIFMRELERVFDHYKGEYGWSRKSLRIV